MSNRILRESICKSDTIDGLSWFEEVFFYRLIVNCDDYGRADARPLVLKSDLFPLKSVTVKTIEDTLNRLSEAGLVYLYNVNDRPYLQLVTWEKYQRIRTKKSKFPAPDVGADCGQKQTSGSGLKQEKTFENKCCQMSADENKCSFNPIQSESKSEFETESVYMHGADKSASMPDSSAVFSLILNDKSYFEITQESIDHWGELYPAVDITAEIRKMQGWLEANPGRRKTKKGIMRFINSWLSQEQDKGGSKYGNTGGNTEEVRNRTPQYGTVF